MNKILENIYYRSPVFLQNAAVSALGYQLYRERYNKSWWSMCALLQKTEKYNADMMKEHQRNEFVNMARHAIRNTEYYSNWAKNEGIDPQDIVSLDDIKLFPVIEKSYLREHSDYFYAKGYSEKRGNIELSTSGTTGTALKIITNKVDRARHYAFFTRLRKWYGVMPGDRRATLMGRIIMSSEKNYPPFWRYDFPQKNLLMSSYHLSDKNLKSYYEKLVEFSPDEIFGYPSSLVIIAQYIIENKLAPINSKLVMTTAETLLESQRDILEKAFRAPIVNQYGVVEMSFFAAQNPRGVMEFHPEHGIVEIRDHEGVIRDEGSGELLATGLINWSTPIIRYALGDEVEIRKDKNYSFPVVESLEGRVDDVICTPDGRAIGRLSPVFKKSKNVKQAQVVQNKDKSINLKIVPASEYTDKDGFELIDELRKRIGNDLPINILKCNQINKGSNGKIRLVVSNISHN